MNPLTLHVRNYRCFDQLDLQLPDGCVAILGDNGAGKSSIVNAIDITIFGARSLADCLSDQADGDDLLLELELEHAGELYRIRRTFSPRGRGKTTLDLEWFKTSPLHTGDDTGPGWEPLTCASTKETQDLIEATLGLSRETFRASAFLVQGDGAAFTDAQPRDRKRILAQVLGLDRYDHLQERARQDRRTIEADLQTLDGRTSAARALVEQKPAVTRERDTVVAAVTELADQVADLEREHAALSERYQQAREQDARRTAAAAELRESESMLAAVTLREQAADEADRLISEAAAERAVLPAETDTALLEQRIEELRAAIEAHHAAQVAHDAAKAAAANADAVRDRYVIQARTAAAAADTARKNATDLAATHDVETTCGHCGQTLTTDARVRAIESYLAEADRHDGDARTLTGHAQNVVAVNVPPPPEGEPPRGELVAAVDQLRSLNEAATTRARLAERISQLEPARAGRPTIDEIESARAAVAAARTALEQLAPVDIDGITRQGTTVKQRLEAARTTSDEQRTLRARLDERLAQIAGAEVEIALAATARTHLQKQLETLVALERAFGRDGIPALIVENSAIPYLETEANRIVAALGTSYQVELRTQAELKSGDGLRDTLDVIIATENGERAYETFSGGERTRINLALRIALARLLAHRRGAESRLLAIDEPDGLDEAGMAALVDVLRDLETDFAKLYVVSHVPGLRDSFDTTLSVVRDGDGWSRIGDHGVFEAVPA